MESSLSTNSCRRCHGWMQRQYHFAAEFCHAAQAEVARYSDGRCAGFHMRRACHDEGFHAYISLRRRGGAESRCRCQRTTAGYACRPSFLPMPALNAQRTFHFEPCCRRLPRRLAKFMPPRYTAWDNVNTHDANFPRRHQPLSLPERDGLV